MEGVSARYVRMAWILTALVCAITAIFTVGRKKSVVGPSAIVVAHPTSLLPVSPVKNPMKTLESIYEISRLCIGDHLTLDPTVPADEGCAEAVSFVLRHAGYEVPQTGIQGVLALITWLLANGFQETTTPVPGAIITAHSTNEADTSWAHCGVVMDFGVCSNTSYPVAGFVAGRWAENYPSVAEWISTFESVGSQTRFFIPV